MALKVIPAAAVLLSLSVGLASAQTNGKTSPPPADQPATRFRTSVDLVSVAAVVRDRKGRFVSDLSSKDFIVVESGKPRPIVSFRAEADGPVKVAILFDISGSMQVGSKAQDAQQAARHLLGGLRSIDQAAVFSFDTKLDEVQRFTSDLAAVEASFERLDPPYGQTSLYDAIAETAKAVAAAAEGPGPLPHRAAVVVLTDGIDTRSRLKPAQVSAIASGIDVPVYVVAVMSRVDDDEQFNEEEEENAGSLRDLARWTGGDLFISSAPAHASVAARQIVGELRHQYLLAFEAAAREGWRALEVKTRDRKLIVRARSGYTAGMRSPARQSGVGQAGWGPF